METKNVSKRRKSTKDCEHNQHRLYDDIIHKKLYDAAIAGRFNDLTEILGNLENQISTDDLEERVWEVYTELQLNNIWLDEDVEFILHKFLSKRFFFQKMSTCPKENDIRNSIKLLIEIVDFFRFFVDEREIFIFSLKCMVKEIYQLKQCLRSTYDELPWEEMEFYILSFIISSTQQHDLNVFYEKILKTSDLIKYLSVFATVLGKVEIGESSELSKLPDHERDAVVHKITEKYPDFKKLYQDFDYIRDIHSLYKISKYGELVRSVQPQEMRGNEFLIRILMVISKHMKYTLTSPKLTQITVDFLLLTTSERSRKIILDMCNTVSYIDAILYKTELIQNPEEEFWLNLRNDLEQIGQIADELLFHHFIQLFRETWSTMEHHTEIMKIEKLFPTLHYINRKQNQATKQHLLRNITERSVEILQKINSTLSSDDPQSIRLKNIETKLRSDTQQLELDGALRYILTPEVVKTIFSDYVLPLSSDDVSELLTILLQIQKDHTSNKYEIAKLNAEMINLLVFRADKDEYVENFKEATNMNQELFIDNNRIQARRQADQSYADLKYKAIKDLKTILEKTKTKKLSTYKKLKNDKKSFEIIKSLVLDIITIDNNFPRFHWMFGDYLEYDYELNDLIFNSDMAAILIAKELIMNPTSENKVSKFRKSLCYQFSIILKKQKVISKLIEGDFEAFKEFVEKGAEIRAKNAEKSTYLHLAVEKADRRQIEYLCDKGLSITCQNLKLQTPLHIAVSKGNTGVVSFLIEKTYPTHYVDEFGRTALHKAVLNGHYQISESLVIAGFDPFFKDLLGLTSLLYAVLSKNKEILSVLLLHTKFLRQDLQHKKELRILFQTAIEINSVEIIEFLLSENYVTLDDDNGGDAISSAVSNGQLEVLNTLLLHGANPINTLLIAVQKNFDLLVEKILESQPDEVKAMNPTDCMTALHYAAKNGNESIIRILLSHEADVNAKNVDNYTPLHFAVENRHLNAVKILLQKKDIKVDSLNSKRYTPLHIAAEIGEYDIAKVLILDKWSLMDSGEYSVTPLQLARRNGHSKIVELLVNNGAFKKTSTSTRNSSKDIQQRPSHKSITLTKKMLDNPSVIIRGVDSDFFKCSNDDIITKIIEQNNLKNNIKSKLEIIAKYLKEDECNIIMVLPLPVYKEIIEKKILNIGWDTCSVSDYFYLFRCYKCAGFGHVHTDCENEEICDKCSEKHKTSECKSEHFKCFHCVDKNESLGLKLDVNHSPFDQFCHWYRKLLKDKYRKHLKEK